MELTRRSFVAGTAANLQTNNRKFVMVGPMATSLYAYHLFSSGDFIHVVIEEMPGRFRHLSFGLINKYGAFAGGQYLTGAARNEVTTPRRHESAGVLTPSHGMTKLPN